MTRQSEPPVADRRPPPSGLAAEFEEIYRANVDTVARYFARRTTDPQTVADLTSDTFVAAITSLAGYDPARGSPRAWLFGIARRTYAQHCERSERGRQTVQRLAGRRPLDADETADLIARIDSVRVGRALLEGLAVLSATDREAVELVDIDGWAPREAAKALDVSSGALRIRLHRARKKLRKLTEPSKEAGDEQV